MKNLLLSAVLLKNSGVSSSTSYCVKERRACVGWVDKYFQDCLCDTRDKLSFAAGMLSLISWGVAEIPQIVTNFRSKSTHGVSLLFLLTWVLGDIFNLIGCLLEPVTLPTQYYTALLYTISTVILVLQCLYYDHVYSWCKGRKVDSNQPIEDAEKPLKPAKENDDDDDGSAISTNDERKIASNFYFTSARSLAGSATPPSRSYLWTAKSGPSALTLDAYSSSDDEADAAATANKKSKTRPKSIPRSAGYGAFLATSLNLPKSTKALIQASVAFSGRKLLQEQGYTEKYVVGQCLGWMMAAVYMGGRIPQIYLNIKRGSVEGLNPLMFIFALIANVAYVGSILIRSTEWDKIKANLPWLLDAVVCVGLDLFIILQYIYYRYLRNRSASGRGHNDGYSESP
ncbi:putative vacuolar amino acid transporter YPQ1 [Heracleum sosnowskyi]|uniref:Vacuolar amino acid transporter YPQ1 n=1 Tax=Heracleum sosnowskyi TaxID=360622 RepID=A0AAD8HAS6_9APIA|nr:putative vacuolar amino acid transporter YPQ1 [Heracleum sosnowskyi]